MQICSASSCPSTPNTTPILGNTVYDYAGVIDNTQQRVYLNGMPDATQNIGGTVMGPHNADVLQIGQNFQGKLDDIESTAAS